MTLRLKVLLAYISLLVVFLVGFYPFTLWWFERSVGALHLAPDVYEPLVQEVRIEVLGFGMGLLVLFAFFAWLIFVYITRPIRRLIEAIDLNALTFAKEHTLVVHPKDDIGKLSFALERLSQKVEQQLQVSRDFVANASHELKTPITIIRGFAETLHDHPDLPPSKSQEITEKIVANCKRMETLVKNLLTLADVENLPLSRLHECDLILLLKNCLQILTTLYPTTVVTFDAKEPLYVMADDDLLELAFMNILNNAAKYSKTGPILHLACWQTDKEVFVSITDQGIGIPQEDLERIFERFYTVNKAHSRKLGGSGLGLAITKHILEKHHGSIKATSRLGLGSTFTITLPRDD